MSYEESCRPLVMFFGSSFTPHIDPVFIAGRCPISAVRFPNTGRGIVRHAPLAHGGPVPVVKCGLEAQTTTRSR